MLFERKFELVEIRDNGVRVTHYMHGFKHEIERELEWYKNNSRDYQLIGKNGMIVWV